LRGGENTRTKGKDLTKGRGSSSDIIVEIGKARKAGLEGKRKREGKNGSRVKRTKGGGNGARGKKLLHIRGEK